MAERKEDEVEFKPGSPTLRQPPSFLTQQKDRPQPAAQAAVDQRPRETGQARDSRDIRELAQRIDGLMFELIDRLENLNMWLGQIPRVK